MKEIDYNTPIKLVFEPEHREIVSFPQGLKGKALFFEGGKNFEEAMAELGIIIPVIERGNYPELKDATQGAIYLDDISFGIAFYEIYYKELDPSKFKWFKI
jgi:hypothetical protein